MTSGEIDEESIPSAEHRRHIRLFLKETLTDAEDVALRGFVIWKCRHHALRLAKQASSLPDENTIRLVKRRR